MANGKFGGGNGAAATPFLIEDADDLNAMRKYLSSHFKLANDINMNVYPYNTHEGWEPIMYFTGTLNGNRHTVFNLYINRPNQDNVGLFGYNNQYRYQVSFRVYDLALENVDITGRNYVGGILAQYKSPWRANHPYGVAYDSMFTRIQVTGKIAGQRFVGGIAGAFDDREFQGVGYWDIPATIVNQCIVSCKIIPTSAAYEEICGVIGIIYFRNSRVQNINTLSYCYSGNTKPVKSISLKYNNGAGDQRFQNNLNMDSTCYCDRTLNPNMSQYTGSFTTEQLKSGDKNLLATWYNAQTDGHSVFRVEKGKYPQLSFVGQNYYFVRTKKGEYFTFDFDKSEWVKHFDKQPSMTQATRVGMNDIKGITKEHWEMLKNEGEVDLVNYRPQVNSVDTIDKIKTMVDSSSEVGNNIVLRKSFGFNSNDDEIINISPVI